MITFNDSRIYFYFGIVTLVLALVTGAVSGYSKFFVESKISAHLSADKDIDKEYKKAYILLRNPQVFALYENFDKASDAVERILAYFDEKIYRGMAMEAGETGDIRYLNKLLERRQQGSVLGFKSAVYLILLSFLSWVMFFVEKKQAAT